MILYILTDTYEKYRHHLSWRKARDTLACLAEDDCAVLHYSRVNPEVLDKMRPWAVCHSGSGTDFAEYDVLKNRPYRSVALGFKGAQIGFCGGHQILAHFFGSRLGAMRRLKPGEPDAARYAAGYFKEWGLCPVKITRRDPLFAGCGETIMVQQNHYWEVKKPGRELVVLASSDNCRVQAFRHRARPIYGTQFHPEKDTGRIGDGRKILRNFFRIARSL